MKEGQLFDYYCGEIAIQIIRQHLIVTFDTTVADEDTMENQYSL